MKGKGMTTSASICPHGDRDEGGFHQSTTAVVIIIRIGRKPKDNSDQDATSSQKGELQNSQLKVVEILISLIAFRHAGLNKTSEWNA